MTEEVRAPRRTDARDNHARILAVAREAYATEGLDVPIREIARRAGVGAATVYRHFRTKEALLAASFADQLTRCSEIMERGLAAADPWEGFCQVIEDLTQLHARDKGFARVFTSELPRALDFTAERDRTVRLLGELTRRAKAAGALRQDFALSDFSLTLMANEGIRAETPALRAAASRRFAALLLQSFRATPTPPPLPPPVPLPLSRH